MICSNCGCHIDDFLYSFLEEEAMELYQDIICPVCSEELKEEELEFEEYL